MAPVADVTDGTAAPPATARGRLRRAAWAGAGPLSTWLPRSEYVHLVYLANLLWQPFFEPGGSWVDWAVVAGVVVAFTPLYVFAHHPDRRIQRATLLATVVLGAGATLLNVGASVLFVYAAAMVAWRDRDRLVAWQAGLTGLCGVLAVVSPNAWPYSLYGVLPSALFIWLIGWMVRADARRAEAAERLRIDNVRIEQIATADERERIARDLHDLVGQSLTGLVVKAQLVQGLLARDPEEAHAHAADLEASARDALAQVRAAIDGLGQVRLADEVETARRTLAAAGVTLDADLDLAAHRPGPLIERVLALAVREATTNVVRHAHATTCTVTLERLDDRWLLVVADDGVGGELAEGNGLRGMRERVLAVGGDVRRDGRGGTRLTVAVPA